MPRLDIEGGGAITRLVPGHADVQRVPDEADLEDRPTPGPVQDNPLLHTTDGRAVRCKRVLISCALLQQLVTQGSDSADFPWGARCTQGLPADARLVHSYVLWHGSGAALAMVFEHAEWPEIPEGQLVPELVVRFEQYLRTPSERLAVQPPEGDGDPREAGQATADDGERGQHA